MSLAPLLALQAPDGATVTLERYPIVLGRSAPGGPVPDVDVTHLDPNQAVAQRHCELLREADGVEVHDLGPSGGTWVDGRRLPPGGSALLRPGGTLRVAAVSLTLIQAGAPLPPPPREPDWRPDRPSSTVPPPPSAWGDGEEEAAPSPALGLELSAAPAIARELLERGARAVRLRPGVPLEALGEEGWTASGKQLTAAAVSDAAAGARRALGLADDALSGQGSVGDLELEFLLPPLVERARLLLRAQPRVPAQLGREERRQLCRAFLEGAAVLLVGHRPDLALAALAEELEHRPEGVSVLSFEPSPWWLPDGWASLDPQHPSALQAGLAGGPLLLDQPPEPVLDELLASLPRSGGGTLLALRCASLESALEILARRLDNLGPETGLPSGARWELVRLLPLALAQRGAEWRGLSLGVGPEGNWTAEPLGPVGERP